MPELLLEIITDILSRLPVESLLRFRCVSKPLCALIDSPDFVKMHLFQSIRNRTNRSLILGGFRKLYSVDIDLLDRAVELDHPLKPAKRIGYIQLWGSCNGLLCISYGKDDLFLWNPSTKKHRKIPVSPIDTPHSSCLYGFGFDSRSDDYKVVRAVSFLGADGYHVVTEVKVYSLNSNSWKNVSDFPSYLVPVYGPGVLASESLHWCTAQEGDQRKLILAFDLRADGFQIVPQPEYEDTNFVLTAGVLGGYLCVNCRYGEARFDIWVLKAYGVKESWTKLLSIKLLDPIGYHPFMKPIAYSKNWGKALIQQDVYRFIWYDFESKIIEIARTDDIPAGFIANECFGSLVPLGGGGGSNGKKQAAQD